MTRRRFRTTATVIAATAVLGSTPGCAALVVGYLVGKSMSDDKATATCRSNLQTINTARITKGEEPFPDQCGR